MQDRYDHFKPNTAIAAFMEWLNAMTAQDYKLSSDHVETVLVLLSTLAPAFCSELLERLCHKQLSECTWPTYDPTFLRETEKTIVVMVNGKVRANITMPAGSAQGAVEDAAKIAVHKWLFQKELIKIIHVPDKLISFVVR